MATSRPRVASIIVENDYSYLKTLDANGWLTKLERLTKILAKAEHPWAKLSLPPSPHELKGRLVETADGETFVVRIGVQPIRLIEPDESGVVRLSSLELPALRVHLDAPDDVILKGFVTALKEARKRYPAPVAAPGRKALNARFGKRIFGVWRNHKIVQVGLLHAWRAGLDEDKQKNYPDVVMGDWLGFDAKKISLANDRLKAALGGLPALSAQIAEDARERITKKKSRRF